MSDRAQPDDPADRRTFEQTIDGVSVTTPGGLFRRPEEPPAMRTIGGFARARSENEAVFETSDSAREPVAPHADDSDSPADDIFDRPTTDPNAPSVEPVNETVAGLFASRRRGPFDGIKNDDFAPEDFIARGGQGEVWRGRQKGLMREVAIKVHHGDDEVAFLQEAYTSGALDHPNIVPVHHLWRLDPSDPHSPHALVMKLVRGRSWMELLAEDRGLRESALEELLARHLPILIDVCQAIGYAHANGIIHRDLKPAQVVVGNFGEVYLIDWGLAISIHEEEARALSPDGVPRFRTRESAMNPAGTPAYMAPEQTDDTTARLGIATDIYQLGAILYELMSGRPPHLRDTGQEAMESARDNAAAPLPSDVPEELVALVNHAMATKPAERPPTASKFREAIEDYLTGAGRRRESEALTARAASDVESLLGAAEQPHGRFAAALAGVQRALQLWPSNPRARSLHEQVAVAWVVRSIEVGDLEFADSTLLRLRADHPQAPELRASIDDARAGRHRRERQRRLAVAAMFLLLAVLSFAAVRVSQLDGERALARAEAERESWRRQAAELESDRQREVAALFEEIDRLRSDELRLADALAGALPIPETLDQPLAPAGGVQGELDGLMQRRVELRYRRKDIEERLAPFDSRLDPEPFELVLGEANATLARAANPAAQLEAANLFMEAARERPELPEPWMGLGIAYAKADQPTSATIALAESARLAEATLGPNHPRLATILSLLAEAHQGLDETSDAYIEYVRRSAAILEPRWARLSTDLARRWYRLGDYDRATQLTSDALAVYDRLGPLHALEAAEAVTLKAISLDNSGRPQLAEPLHRRAVAEFTELAGAVDERTVDALNGLAGNLVYQAKFDEARAVFEDALERITGVADFLPSLRITIEQNLAYVLANMGDEFAAIAILERVVEERRRLYGADHSQLLVAENNLAASYRRVGDVARAEQLFESILERTREHYGADHPYTLRAVNNLGLVLEMRGDLDRAAEVLGEGLAIARQKQGLRDETIFAVLLSNLAGVAESRGDWSEAASLLEEAMEAARGAGDVDRMSLARDLGNYANIMTRLGRLDDAEASALESLALHRDLLGDDHPDVAASLNALANVYQQQERHELAEQTWREAITIQADNPSVSRDAALVTKANLATALAQLDRLDEAEQIIASIIDERRHSAGGDALSLFIPLLNRATILSRLGRHDESLDHFMESLRIARGALPADHPAMVSAWMALALGRAEAKDWTGAWLAARRALQVQLRSEGVHHHATRNVALVAVDMATRGAIPQRADEVDAEPLTASPAAVHSALVWLEERLLDGDGLRMQSFVTIGDDGERNGWLPLLERTEAWATSDASPALGDWCAARQATLKATIREAADTAEAPTAWTDVMLGDEVLSNSLRQQDVEAWNAIEVPVAQLRAAESHATAPAGAMEPLEPLAALGLDLDPALVRHFPGLADAAANDTPQGSIAELANSAFEAYSAGDLANATRLIDAVTPRMYAILDSGRATPAIRRAFGETFYNAACYHSLAGNLDEAFDYFEDAFALEIDHLKANARVDTDLAPLRDADGERFEAALSRKPLP